MFAAVLLMCDSGFERFHDFRVTIDDQFAAGDPYDSTNREGQTLFSTRSIERIAGTFTATRVDLHSGIRERTRLRRHTPPPARRARPVR